MVKVDGLVSLLVGVFKEGGYMHGISITGESTGPCPRILRVTNMSLRYVVVPILTEETVCSPMVSEVLFF